MTLSSVYDDAIECLRYKTWWFFVVLGVFTVKASVVKDELDGVIRDDVANDTCRRSSYPAVRTPEVVEGATM